MSAKAASKPFNPNAKKIMYPAGALAAYWQELKKQAAPGTQWWRSTDPALPHPIDIEWRKPRRAQSGNTTYCSIRVTNRAGQTDELNASFIGERHCGQIAPLTQEGVARLIAKLTAQAKAKGRSPPAWMAFEPRGDKKQPSLSIQKWRARVATEDDGFTLRRDASGNPELPPPETASPYYALSELLNEAFMAEGGQRVEWGRRIFSDIADFRDLGGAASPKPSLQEALANFATRRCKGVMPPSTDILVESSAMEQARGSVVVSEAEWAELCQKVTPVPSTKLVPLVQLRVGAKAKKNANVPLANPMTRITIEFDKESGEAKTELKDKSKPFTADGKTRYEAAKVTNDAGEQVPVTAENVHEFVCPRSPCDGIVRADAVCYSAMGISIPVKLKLAVVDKAPEFGDAVDEDDLYGAQPDATDGARSSAGAPAPASPAPADPDETGTPDNGDTGAPLEPVGIDALVASMEGGP